MNPGVTPAWGADWAWGVPLILLTVVFHAYCLSRIVEGVSHRLDGKHAPGQLLPIPIFIVGGTALSATLLHGFEGAVWAIVYRLFGRIAGLEVCGSLFSGGDDELRPRESVFSATLANARRAGSVERLDSLWPDHRISFCCNSEGMAE